MAHFAREEPHKGLAGRIGSQRWPRTIVGIYYHLRAHAGAIGAGNVGGKLELSKNERR
jgi:hypothetical protein